LIAVDSSSLVAFLANEKGRDVDALTAAFESQALVLPPAVIAELYSDAKTAGALGDVLNDAPLLPISEGFWMRAGMTRAKVIAHGHKARLPDALVCQSCLDHDVRLITRDADFRHFAKHCGLKLA
jgi:predicted nucleic acid-binding protein